MTGTLKGQVRTQVRQTAHLSGSTTATMPAHFHDALGQEGSGPARGRLGPGRWFHQWAWDNGPDPPGRGRLRQVYRAQLGVGLVEEALGVPGHFKDFADVFHRVGQYR